MVRCCFTSFIGADLMRGTRAVQQPCYSNIWS